MEVLKEKKKRFKMIFYIKRITTTQPLGESDTWCVLERVDCFPHATNSCDQMISYIPSKVLPLIQSPDANMLA